MPNALPTNVPANIWLCTTSLRVGGTERQIELLVRGLTGLGSNVHVVGLEPRGPMADRWERAGARVTALGIPQSRGAARGSWTSTWTALRSARRGGNRLADMLANERPDVLHTFLFHANVLGAWAVRNARSRGFVSPLVWSFRTAAPRRRWRRLLERRLAPEAAQLTFVSDAARSLVLPRLGSNLAHASCVVPNAVQVPIGSADPGGSGPFVAVGRLARDKDPALLIEAWRRLEGQGQSAPDLHLVGDGELRPQLEAQAQGLPIRFLGQLDAAGVSESLRSAVAFVMPAGVGEGSPNAVLEAMAHGLPVIAPDRGGLAELVVSGRNGLLCAADPNHLAEAVMRLQREPATRRRLGCAAREVVLARHSIDSVTRTWLRIYEQVCMS
ncbi:MAG: glycosyltransferase family 4 protein [Planctomycetota bacterium]|jgi:glycosyltransferase involved in cell wall biosynthesis